MIAVETEHETVEILARHVIDRPFNRAAAQLAPHVSFNETVAAGHVIVQDAHTSDFWALLSALIEYLAAREMWAELGAVVRFSHVARPHLAPAEAAIGAN